MDLDLYSILGITKTSDKRIIKKAYRKQAMLYHPDKNPGDRQAEEKFKLIYKAYSILYDDQKRAGYDWLRQESKNNSQTSYYREQYHQYQAYEPEPQKPEGWIQKQMRIFFHILFLVKMFLLNVMSFLILCCITFFVLLMIYTIGSIIIRIINS